METEGTNPPPQKVSPTDGTEEKQGEVFVRDKRRKCALQFGFIGTKYYGIQQNPGVPTVEEELHKAFKALNIYRPEENNLGSLSYTRCSRTDKGVSAVALISGLKLPSSCINDDFPKRINSVLPDDIKVERVTRATSGFHAQKNCESRVYEYLIPIEWIVCDIFNSDKNATTESKVDTEKENYNGIKSIKTYSDIKDLQTKAIEGIKKTINSLKEKEAKKQNDSGEIDENGEENIEYNIECLEQMIKNEEDLEKNAPVEQYLEAESVYNNEIKDKPIPDKETEEKMKEKLRNMPGYIRLSKALEKYVGTHNFHNYTIGLKATAPSARRCIKSFTTSLKWFVPATGENQMPHWFVVAKVHGMSFITWHIRRMIGASVAVARLRAPLSWIDGSMTYMATGVPTAPGRYLYLVGPLYEQYNERYPHIDPIPVMNDLTEEMRQRIQQTIVDGAALDGVERKASRKRVQQEETDAMKETNTCETDSSKEQNKNKNKNKNNNNNNEDGESDETIPLTEYIDMFNFYERTEEIAEQYESMVRFVLKKRARIAEKLKEKEDK